MRTGLQLARPTHALGKLIQAHAGGVPFQITGTDYPTRDGSGIRDYIHVWDLAAAHLAALSRFDALLSGPARSTAINVGTGDGTTVRELVEAFNSVVDVPVAVTQAPPRPGDVAGSYARTERARAELDWQPRYSVVEGIRHSLEWAAIRDDILGPE
jgi:UDP-glucose 4-epimerase